MFNANVKSQMKTFLNIHEWINFPLNSTTILQYLCKKLLGEYEFKSLEDLWASVLYNCIGI